MAPKTRPISDRFWEKVDSSAGAESCWPWKASYFRAAKGGGPYGRFVLRRLHSVLAHRVAYELVNGTIGESEVRHTCDNPGCCNPQHLVLGSHQDNMNDRSERGRTARGAHGGRAKLTEADVIEIRGVPMTYSQIRERFGICDGSIHAIKTRRNWRHV